MLRRLPPPKRLHTTVVKCLWVINVEAHAACTLRPDGKRNNNTYSIKCRLTQYLQWYNSQSYIIISHEVGTWTNSLHLPIPLNGIYLWLLLLQESEQRGSGDDIPGPSSQQRRSKVRAILAVSIISYHIISYHIKPFLGNLIALATVYRLLVWHSCTFGDNTRSFFLWTPYNQRIDSTRAANGMDAFAAYI